MKEIKVVSFRIDFPFKYFAGNMVNHRIILFFPGTSISIIGVIGL